MSERTEISWADSTWNPWIGCIKISPGCKNCYAEQSTPTRVARSKGVELWGGTKRQRASKTTFEAPLRWNEKPWVCDACGTAKEITGEVSKNPISYCQKCDTFSSSYHRRRVFSLSLGDWLDPDVPIEWLAEILDVIRQCPNLDFLLLTKRPELWESRTRDAFMSLSKFDLATKPGTEAFVNKSNTRTMLIDWRSGIAPTNIWIGTTVEDQTRKKRIDEARKIPAAVRFLSIEPQLEDIGQLDLTGIHWVIVGGESGHHARPFDISWARSIVKQCQAAGVACFVRQLGAQPFYQPHEKGAHGPIYWMRESDIEGAGIIKDKKGGNISEFPEDLRIRQFPERTK